METIKTIRTLKSAGILADKSAKETRPDFLRYNLVYGFNGSGKSTLSRILACLQSGKQQAGLPEGCTFEIQTDEATSYVAPDKLAGLEQRVCVFNTDFIERNLRWSEGKANSIFYISQEQADAAAELKDAENGLPALVVAQSAASTRIKDLDRALAGYKTQRAKAIAGKLHHVGRKYEAPSLVNDYEDLPFDEKSIVNEEKLNCLEEVARRSSPQPPVVFLKFDSAHISALAFSARKYASATIGEVVIPAVADHPDMVPWVRTGHEYHEKHDLSSCLFCGETLTAERKALLAAAFDNKLSKFMADLEATHEDAQETVTTNTAVIGQLPQAEALSPEFRDQFVAAAQSLTKTMQALNTAAVEALRVLKERQKRPIAQVSTTLPSEKDFDVLSEKAQLEVNAVNEPIRLHNETTADFAKYQTKAREKIRAHFLAEGSEEFESHKIAADGAKIDFGTADKAVLDAQQKIQKLRDQVRTHGPAAPHITRLVHAYLGHNELSVVSVKDGYELHRHGRLVTGPPSEGEKTALALCYFLSTLEAEGRKIKDLIVVVDDPISSLDTKAMHYACALIRGRLGPTAQLIVLTHNLQCMNEFKKDWRKLAYPEDPEKAATAAFMFIDVTIPAGKTARTATLIEMPKYLRAYDSEYHFLCHRVLEFEAKGAEYFEYAYMMPHVIRRVLDVFLAFKVPGSDSLKGKITALCTANDGLDPVRLVALERLAQGESHSDNLDDLIGQSSMTVEESRDANAALLELMRVVDPNHTAAIRKQCAA